jgi:hypothetical protein
VKSSSAILPRLSASVLLATSVVLVAACRASVAIDCTGAKAEPGGLLLCADDAVARSASAACPTPCTPGAGYDCVPCTQDSDCGPGYNNGNTNLCYCGPNGGDCVISGCRANAECAPGHACVRYSEGWCHGYPIPSFLCTTDSDECVSDAGCGPGEACTLDGGHLACVKLVTGPCTG